MTAGHGVINEIAANTLSTAKVELPNGTLTANGQTIIEGSASLIFFVQRTSGSGSYTAELTVTDDCGPYPLFFGAGS